MIRIGVWLTLMPSTTLLPVTTILPSTTSIENYLNANPVRGFSLWQGNRNYGQLATFVFQVKNQTFTQGGVYNSASSR